MRITSFFFFTRFSIWWFYFSIRLNPPGSTRKPMLTHHGRGGEVNGPIKFAFWNPGSAVLITFTLLEMCETMAWRHNIQEFRTRIGFMSNDAAVGTWPLRLRLRAKFKNHGINVWSGSDEQNSEQKHYPGHGFCVSTRARSVDSTTT